MAGMYPQNLSMPQSISIQPTSSAILKPPDGGSGYPNVPPNNMGMLCMPSTSKPVHAGGQVSPNSTPSDLSMKKVENAGSIVAPPVQKPPSKKTGFTIADIMGR